MKKRNRWLSLGGGLAIFGLVIAGSIFSISGPGVALAGGQTPLAGCDATATPTQANGNISAFGVLVPTNTPIATCTPTKVKTHTPTPKPTEAATETSVPSTNTPVPPPATNTPAGNTVGVVVKPPSTGSGGYGGYGSGGYGGSDNTMLWVLISGALIAAGGGAALVGVRSKS